MRSITAELELHIRELLVPRAADWGLALGETEIVQFAAYGAELIRWNARVNLTRIVDPREIIVRHFLDSLSCVRAFAAEPAMLVDVGTGAGFPGIPLKIVWPATTLTLNESIGKKTAFLTHVAALLELRDVTVVTSRAEQLGQDPAHRERYDAVVARAVAALNVLSEYALPLCRLGGRFVAQKGGDGAAEAARAAAAIDRLGGELRAILPVDLPRVEPRTLVVVDKLRQTPAGLPRRVGMPARRPL